LSGGGQFCRVVGRAQHATAPVEVLHPAPTLALADRVARPGARASWPREEERVRLEARRLVKVVEREEEADGRLRVRVRVRVGVERSV